MYLEMMCKVKRRKKRDTNLFIQSESETRTTFSLLMKFIQFDLEKIPQEIMLLPFLSKTITGLSSFVNKSFFYLFIELKGISLLPVRCLSRIEECRGRLVLRDRFAWNSVSSSHKHKQFIPDSFLGHDRISQMILKLCINEILDSFSQI